MSESREILLGVTGGIAAYKSADLASKLVQDGHGVTVVMTKAAHAFIGKTTFEALTDRPVYTSLFDWKEHPRGEHIGLARRADIFVIAPCSADVLSKLAHGAADDLLSTLTLSATCPMLLAPAMNVEMWSKAAVQRNVEQLRDDGFHFAEPGSGWLSCREVGAGRMAEPEEIRSRIAEALA
ncbi:flavoprotein [Stratiformator vulcanicus]|uniref:Phosphopantothenoylcysteine decarboxylase n=1 Tax=Stratiformator vulcanicus TaxID=2527980 RepID=A0A517R6J9_9PLAN|nr:phosphopantothenoylcysteine decarboxylase [Stratiformator vulcanicus]QDT39463.1 Phosphopantothenoylcysteine decarboxylase [Stratiformator vulcanicus]